MAQFSECEESVELLTNGFYRAIVIVYVIISIIGVALTIFLTSTLYKKIFFHENLKILLSLLLVVSCAHCVVLLASVVFHARTYFPYDCNLFTPVRICLIFRVPAVFFIILMVFCQSAIVAERTIASFHFESYEESSRRLGRVLGTIAVVTSALLCVWLFSPEDLNEMQINCGSFSNSTFQNANNIYWYAVLALCVKTPRLNKDSAVMLSDYYNEMYSLPSALISIDFCNFVLFMLIWKYNKRMVLQSHSRAHERYQINENLYVVELVAPISLAHFLIFGIYMGSLLIVRSQKDIMEMVTYRVACNYCYIVPLFTMALPCLVIYIHHRTERRRRLRLTRAINSDHTGDQYFHSLRLQWNSPRKGRNCSTSA